MGGVGLARLGEGAKARDWANQALAINSNDATVLYNVACIYSLSGEIDDAVSMLERSVNAGFGHWDWIENDSDFEPLHDNPGYQTLLAQKH